MIKNFIQRILGKKQKETDHTKPVTLGPKEHGIDPQLVSSNAVRVTQTLQEAGFKADRERYLLATHGAHIYDTVRYLLGEPKELGSRPPAEREQQDSFRRDAG